MIDQKLLGWLILVAIVLIVGAWIKRAGGRRRYPAGALPYRSRRNLLSPGELAFFHALRSALPPGLMIAPKVRVADILACDAMAWKRGFGGRISQKHVDFVLIDERTTGFALIVELDDKSHRQRDRRDRDEFLDRAFAAAGIPIVHVPAGASYDVGQVRALITRNIRAHFDR